MTTCLKLESAEGMKLLKSSPSFVGGFLKEGGLPMKWEENLFIHKNDL